MLGQLDVVKAHAAAIPEVQALRGPHGITLLSHAKAGGADASAVVVFLETLGSDRPYATEPLSAEQQQAIAGTYVFGAGVRDRFIVDVERNQLGITRVGATRRNLRHAGDLVFHPPGAPNVRIAFQRTDATVSAMTITDADLVVRATRAS
jgi:hypothetical protein